MSCATIRRSSHILLPFALLLAALVASACSMAPAPVASAPLHGDTVATVDGQNVEVHLAPGARFAQSGDHIGAANGSEYAVEVPVPTGAWGPRGSVAFWMVFAKTRLAGQSKRVVPFVQTPAINFRMRGTFVLPGAKRGEGSAPGSTVAAFTYSRFLGGKPYHVVMAWDADTGKIEMYLNGVLQASGYYAPWRVTDTEGPLRVGIPAADGRMQVDSVQYFSEFLSEADVKALLAKQDVPALEGEGRTIYEGSIDLSPYKRTVVYETEFSDPLRVVDEDALFKGNKRVAEPGKADWVLEGKGRAWSQVGRLFCSNQRTNGEGSHTVLWNTRVFPKDFLLEFDFSPRDSHDGLGIVFFASRPTGGGSIFDLDMPKREGVFKNYLYAPMTGYHTSYWAAAPETGSRRTVNLRKNPGFHLASLGVERIAGKGPGPHRVRILKVGNEIWVETRGKLSLHYLDEQDWKLPVWQDGYIGLRQMQHSVECSYGFFRVSKIEAK